MAWRLPKINAIHKQGAEVMEPCASCCSSPELTETSTMAGKLKCEIRRSTCSCQNTHGGHPLRHRRRSLDRCIQIGRFGRQCNTGRSVNRVKCPEDTVPCFSPQRHRDPVRVLDFTSQSEGIVSPVENEDTCPEISGPATRRMQVDAVAPSPRFADELKRPPGVRSRVQ